MVKVAVYREVEYDRDPDLIFGERLGDVYYQVHAWSLEDGIMLALPMYNTFEELVAGLFPGLPPDRQNIMAKAEYGKCVISSARGLAAQGKKLPDSIHIEPTSSMSVTLHNDKLN